MSDLCYNTTLTNSTSENLILISDTNDNDNQVTTKINDSKTTDFDNIIVGSEDTNSDHETKLQNSRWLQPFRNNNELKKKSPDYFEKNEIVQSWKEKIRKMTKSDII